MGGRGRGSVGLGGWGSEGLRVLDERVLVFVVWALMVSARRTESMRRVRVLYWWVETGGRDFGGEGWLERATASLVAVAEVLGRER